MQIDIEYSIYLEIMNNTLSLITMMEHEGLDTKKQWGLLKCLRGMLKKQHGIAIKVDKDSLGDYFLRCTSDNRV